MKTVSKTRIMVEGALMIAASVVLSFIRVYTLPNGGSLSLVPLLPLLMMSYRHGVKWGAFTCFVRGLISLLIGFYAPPVRSLYALTMEVLLDYLLPYMVLALACVIADIFKNKMLGIGFSALVTGVAKYLIHVLSGYIVWKDYAWALDWMSGMGFAGLETMSEDGLCWLYSFVYNAIGVLPEVVLTAVLAAILYKTAPKLFKA